MSSLPKDVGSVGFILASASPARARTLQSAGIEPKIAPADVDEDAGLTTGRKYAASRAESFGPVEQVNLLARIKAEASLATGRKYTTNRPYVLLGCDSMLELDGRMLGKPHDAVTAFHRIQEMRGRDGVLWTGHHLILAVADSEGKLHAEQAVGGAEPTTVHFGHISDEEIRAYVATGEPLEVAGSFTIDGLGGPFLRGVTGDPHSVVGVSLPLVRDLASRMGVFWPSLWNKLP